jgi:hypothetical protein
MRKYLLSVSVIVSSIIISCQQAPTLPTLESKAVVQQLMAIQANTKIGIDQLEYTKTIANLEGLISKYKGSAYAKVNPSLSLELDSILDDQKAILALWQECNVIIKNRLRKESVDRQSEELANQRRNQNRENEIASEQSTINLLEAKQSEVEQLAASGYISEMESLKQQFAFKKQILAIKADRARKDNERQKEQTAFDKKQTLDKLERELEEAKESEATEVKAKLDGSGVLAISGSCWGEKTDSLGVLFAKYSDIEKDLSLRKQNSLNKSYLYDRKQIILKMWKKSSANFQEIKQKMKS